LPAVEARLSDTAWLHSVRRQREKRSLRIRQGVELRENVWKAKGGLLRCACAVEDDRVAWVSLSGDFFIHPAAALAELEAALTGCPIGEVGQAATAFLARPGVVMPGVAPEDVERVVLGAA